jgi:DNA-binding LacI/PurR family transcriptional regulator
MAVQLMDALEGAGLRVPQDVSVVGFDGIDLGAHSRIALTTIAQPRAELAALGLDLLVRRMAARAPASPPRRVTLEPVLVARGSTAGPRAET